ncbi:MAG: hypothetical protein N3D85_02385 [Candidatus Bathyarchaeota archaeon]|nr:hypothetical protein [Candidatus Bathyarchaeota archaeon]
MNLSKRQLHSFLFTVECVGTGFVGLFLFVYLLGLRDVPRDVVYHSEPLFRGLLSALGVLFVVSVLIAAFLAFIVKKKL